MTFCLDLLMPTCTLTLPQMALCFETLGLSTLKMITHLD